MARKLCILQTMLLGYTSAMAPLCLQSQLIDEEKAREVVERTRWPEGPVCPYCHCRGRAVRLASVSGSKHGVREGTWRCKACRRQFSVTVGTVFEHSHVPLRKWLYAIRLVETGSSELSGHQLERILGVSYRTAWYVVDRIRQAKGRDPLLSRLCQAVADEAGADGTMILPSPRAG